jgi:hypothetical protein
MLRNPHSGATVSDVLLLVDTGADITLLPRTAVEHLGVPMLAGQRYELMGFDGRKSFAPVVMLALLLLAIAGAEEFRHAGDRADASEFDRDIACLRTSMTTQTSLRGIASFADHVRASLAHRNGQR